MTISASGIRRLMRRHRVTMRELKARHAITLKRVREVRAHGVEGEFAGSEWVFLISGAWPAPGECLEPPQRLRAVRASQTDAGAAA
jgi:hypothetical protein